MVLVQNVREPSSLILGATRLRMTLYVAAPHSLNKVARFLPASNVVSYEEVLHPFYVSVPVSCFARELANT